MYSTCTCVKTFMYMCIYILRYNQNIIIYGQRHLLQQKKIVDWQRSCLETLINQIDWKYTGVINQW